MLDEILNAANRGTEHVARHKDKNQVLVDFVLRKRQEAQEAFYKALSQSEPFMQEELKVIIPRRRFVVLELNCDVRMMSSYS